MRGKKIVTCKHCESKDIEYSCNICNSATCFKHTGSTDKYFCKKHNKYHLNRIQAEVRKNRCQIVEYSRCPSCGSFLEIAVLPNGQKYLQCTKCSWNSRTNSPIIINNSEKQVLREAERYGLSRHAEKCNERLRRNKGKTFCIDCFNKELHENIETSYYQLQHKFGLAESDIELIVNEMLSSSKTIEGFLDTKNKTFIHLTPSIEAQLVTDLHSQGYLELNDIKTKLKASPSTTTRIMIELIRKNKFRGTFTNKKNRYFLEAGLTKLILQEIQNQGKVVHADLAKKYDIAEGNVKNYIMALMKNKLLKAFFADSGKITISEEELDNDIENFCIQKGVFMLTALANHLKIAPELARRALFKLIQNGLIRGIFTQNHEFITEEKLSEKIKAIARAYRTISIKDLAKKLAITEQRVEEGLATLISKGSVNGYIDMAKHQFVADGKQPVTSFESHSVEKAHSAQNMAAGPVPKGDVEVVRQYDFVGGQLHFKVVVRNKSNMAIHDIKVILDVPSSYRRSRELLTIPVIDPGNTHGVDFYLEPAECGISRIGGTVIYKDALGKFNTIYINPKDIQIKCPLLIKSLDTIEDCQKAIQSLPSDARAFLIADLPSPLAYSAAHRAVAQFDVTNVASYENDKGENYVAEAWFSSEAKVTGGRVITRVYINGATSTLEIRVWCNDAGQLTGLLAKMIELLFIEINLMRHIKSEERTKTLEVMAITRNLMEISNICMLRYKASSAKLKLEDTYTRLNRINISDESNEKIYEWVKKLEEDYKDEEAMLSDEEADLLDNDIQNIHQKLQSQLGIV